MSTPTNPVEYRAALKIRPFSPAFEVVTKAIYGLPLSFLERRTFDKLSGGRSPRPGVGFEEVAIFAGRGSGKDDWLKSIANHEARHGGHEVAGAPGQRLPFQIVAPLRNQAQGTVRMVQGEAHLAHNARFIRNETTDSVEYSNNCCIQVQTCDSTAVVGDTLIGLGYNEWCLFPDDSAVIEANHRPGLRRVEGAPPKRFLKVSSVYIKDGPPWELFEIDFGNDNSDVLVIHGTTEQFNPNVDKKWLANERKRLGPLHAAMHFDSEWQDAIVSGYFPPEAVAKAVITGQTTLPTTYLCPTYVAIDAAFSETGDKFGIAAVSAYPGTATVHAAAAWPANDSPRALANRVREFCQRYNTTTVYMDQFCAPVFAQMLQEVGLDPVRKNWTAGDGDESKASRYRSFRASLISGEMRFPDVPDLVKDLYACRATLLPGGGLRIGVSRTKRGHGDCLSAVVLGITEAIRQHGNALFAAGGAYDVRVPVLAHYWSPLGDGPPDNFEETVKQMAGGSHLIPINSQGTPVNHAANAAGPAKAWWEGLFS